MEGRLSFFELGVGDTERGRAFYGGLFGWEFEPGPGGGYDLRTPSEAGAGMHGDDAGASPYVFFEVADIEAATRRVAELGGEVLGSPGGEDAVGEYGRFRICRDDQGSTFGLHQPPD